MRFYKFQAVDNLGKFHRGKLIAESEQEIVEYLSSIGLTPIKVTLSTESFVNKILRSFRKLSLKDKIFFARNISLILKSGAGLIEGLKIFVRNLKDGYLKDFVLFLIYNLQKGNPFYLTFQYFPESFTPVEVELIKIGELSGNLSKTFDNWVEDLEKEKNVRTELLSSLLYPSIILIAAFGVIILVTTFVMPKIAGLVEQMGTKLPTFSRVILSTGIWIGDHIKIIFAILALLIIIFISLFVTRNGRRILLLIALKLPILKTLILNMNLRSFCFVFGSLIESGITVSQSLYLTSLVISHPELKEAALRMHQKIQGGANFEEVLVQERIFPPVFSGVMIIGSETGNLSKVLEVMEKYYEDEVKYSIKNLMTLLEPLLIVFVGIIVGLIAISIVVPVYQQISAQLEQGLQQRQMP